MLYIIVDQTNNTVTRESQLKRCIHNKETWEKLTHKLDVSKNSIMCNGDGHIPNGHVHTGKEAAQNDFHSDRGEMESHALPSISHCVNWVCKRSTGNTENGNFSEKHTDAKLNGQIVENGGCDKNHRCDTNGVAERNGHVNGTVEKKDVGASKCDQHVQVLVTGSMHLVGGALKVLWNKE